jgi:hypothetical protein
MMKKPAKILTYRQERPADFIREYPHEKWRCDIFPADGSDHHGVGPTEAEALFNATLAYLRWIGKESAV